MTQDVGIVSQKSRLRQIRCFATVARMKSSVAVAETLGPTQPAVSRRVREFEQIPGHPLFDRATRGGRG